MGELPQSQGDGGQAGVLRSELLETRQALEGVVAHPADVVVGDVEVFDGEASERASLQVVDLVFVQEEVIEALSS